MDDVALQRIVGSVNFQDFDDYILAHLEADGSAVCASISERHIEAGKSDRRPPCASADGKIPDTGCQIVKPKRSQWPGWIIDYIDCLCVHRRARVKQTSGWIVHDCRNCPIPAWLLCVIDYTACHAKNIDGRLHFRCCPGNTCCQQQK